MGPSQIIQGLFNVVIVILRFVGLVLSQIPGTKHLLKHLPWHKDEDFEPSVEVQCRVEESIKSQVARRRELRNSPEHLEKSRRSKLSTAERAIEDNNDIVTTQFNQPINISLSTKLNGTLVQ